jgi:hypothetical protein
MSAPPTPSPNQCKALTNCNTLQRRGLGSAILRLVDNHVSQIICHAPSITLRVQCAPALRTFFERAGYALAATAGGSSCARSPLTMLKSVHTSSAPPPASCLATAALATSWCGNRRGTPYESALSHRIQGQIACVHRVPPACANLPSYLSALNINRDSVSETSGAGTRIFVWGGRGRTGATCNR